MIIAIYNNEVIPPEQYYRKCLAWVLNDDAVPKKNGREWVYYNGFHKYHVRIKQRKTICPPKKWGGKLVEWDNAKGVFVPFYEERKEEQQ